ncbi:PucR family transcriptional regulator [Parasporobacterium paucivorans]|uniref:PucR C-terminal helix-turn-helix domain-containing protein n=1 Tax=Parasporobacterium paucivorans DSM 15970 TaxID=1122934 RepID=A0A1M6CYE4_9FIRM|nr:helix-turn-helix domain-containing protein [Parasporobacterium paucivorans]SHI66042.1 PucR C-terminal helix-turn-helix domain-containing protein [Parasporobacterium paucivorans DSM 15970]
MDKQKHDLLEIYEEFHANMDKPGFRPLIRCASKIFDAPVLFTDNQYRLISLFPAKKIGDFVYDTLLKTGCLPDETIKAFHEEYLKKPGTRYQPFFEKDGLVKNFPRIFAEVYNDATVIGHIAVFLEEKDFKPWHLEAASILTSTLRIKINLTSQVPLVHSYSLQSLLNRNTTKQEKARAIVQLSKINKEPALLLVAPLDQIKSQHAFASVAINYCLHNFPSSLPIIYNDDLVILLTNENEQTLLTAVAEKISEYLMQYKILCGAVNPVTDIYSLPDYYLQARLTAIFRYRDEVTNNNLHTPLYYYHEIAPSPLFLYLSQHEEYACFIHPALEKIKKYDSENNTEFYMTLECFCKNLFQKNESSEHLHIHRNTLNYRLNRIEVLFGLDLNDYKTLLSLLISLEMITYQK